MSGEQGGDGVGDRPGGRGGAGGDGALPDEEQPAAAPAGGEQVAEDAAQSAAAAGKVTHTHTHTHSLSLSLSLASHLIYKPLGLLAGGEVGECGGQLAAQQREALAGAIKAAKGRAGR